MTDNEARQKNGLVRRIVGFYGDNPPEESTEEVVRTDLGKRRDYNLARMFIGGSLLTVASGFSAVSAALELSVSDSGETN